MQISINLENGEQINLSDNLIYLVNFEESFNREFDIQNLGKSVTEFFRVGYAMINPKPNYSFEEFMNKATNSDMLPIVQAVKKLMNPEDAQNKKIKN